jgi:hypothetical protein
MRYEVDVEEYGTLTLESQDGKNVFLTMGWDNENSMTFDMSADEFKTLSRAMAYVTNELEERA